MSLHLSYLEELVIYREVCFHVEVVGIVRGKISGIDDRNRERLYGGRLLMLFSERLQNCLMYVFNDFWGREPGKLCLAR